MAVRKFLTSVADVYGYDQSDNLLFTAKAMLDTTFDVTLGSTPIRGGRGAQLQYVYYHTGEMKVTLTDTQWNLGFLAATVGSDINTGNNVYTEETVTLGAAVGTVVGTPLAWNGGAAAYGWVTQKSGVVDKVTFTGKTFPNTSGAENDVVCVRYYNADLAKATASRSFTINANIVPSVVKLVMEAQLNSADISTNKIGIVQIIVPTLTLSGAFNISMKADGVSSTPLTGMALAFTEAASAGAGCATSPYYAKVVEILDSSNWYDNVIGLSIQGGDFGITAGTSPMTLQVWAIPSSGAAFKPPVADLSFTSDTTATATVGLHTGIVTRVANGTSLLHVSITAAPTIETAATVTAS